jgi:hypothetical protein
LFCQSVADIKKLHKCFIVCFVCYLLFFSSPVLRRKERLVLFANVFPHIHSGLYVCFSTLQVRENIGCPLVHYFKDQWALGNRYWPSTKQLDTLSQVTKVKGGTILASLPPWVIKNNDVRIRHRCLVDHGQKYSIESIRRQSWFIYKTFSILLLKMWFFSFEQKHEYVNNNV